MEIIRKRKIVRRIDYDLFFEFADSPGSGYSFPCGKGGNIIDDEHKDSWGQNLSACLAGSIDGRRVIARGVRTWRTSHVEPAVARCDACHGEAISEPRCGAFVCESCGNHLGLVRCFCGWAASGGNGLTELIEMGEQIEPE